VSATHFQPPESYQQDAPPGEEREPEDVPPAPGAHLTLPSLNIARTFTREEMAKYRLGQATLVHVSLLNGVF